VILSFCSAPQAALDDLQRGRGDIVTRLRRIAAALREAEIIDESDIAPLFDFRRRFDAVRDDLLAKSRDSSTTPSSGTSNDCESLEELAALWRNEQSRAAVLTRLAGLQSVTSGNLLMIRLQTETAEIEEQYRSRWTLTPQAREFADGTGPLAAFEQLVTVGSDLTDERWDEAHQQVRATYGVAVARAAARGRLTPAIP
jgi:hypothetical protein